MQDLYDVVVIGAGPAGENVADYAIRGSDRTALLIENELVGGECSYYACMPSKALLRPLEVRRTAENLEGLPDQVELDTAALLRRRDAWVAHYRDAGQVDWANSVGVEVARGFGRLSGPKQVEIVTDDGVRTVRAGQAVVIATGSSAVIPKMFADLHPWTSRDATGVVEVPGRIAVIGGGVVASEASLWLAGLGAQVTQLVRGPRLLSRLEPFAAELVADGLARAGVEVVFDAELAWGSRLDGHATGLGRIHGGPVRLGIGESDREFDEVLVATGRKPALKGIGLGSIGLGETDFLDPSRRPDWLLTVGDASGAAQLTHWGKYEARLIGQQLADRAAGWAVAPPMAAPVPQVVFTDPQVAAVGLTRAEAEAAGLDVRCPQVPMTSAAGYSLLRNDAPGAAQLVIEQATGKLLGATFVGSEVAELVHAATVAIVGGMDVTQLRHAVPSYPTASEVWLRLLEQS